MTKLVRTLRDNRGMLANFLLVVLVVFAMVTYFLNSPWGIGVGYDSMYYLDAADGVLQGVGLVKVGSGGEIKPMDHFPPLYPLSLAFLARLLGDSTINAARWLGAILLGLNVGLIGLLISRFGRSPLAGIVGALLAFISPILLEVHFDAMSEPFFLFFLLLFFGLFTIYFERQSIGWLIGVAFAAGLSFLTRYIGSSIFITGVIALLIWGQGTQKQRAKAAVQFLAVGALPVIPWVIRNLTLTGSPTDRIFSFHPISSEMLRKGAVTISSWILPVELPVWIRLLALALFGVGLLLLIVEEALRWREKHGKLLLAEEMFLALLLLFTFVYLLSLILSMTFFDASTPLTNRILSPVYLSLVIMGVALTARLLRSAEKQALVFFVTLVIALFLIISYSTQSFSLWEDLREEGRRLTSRSWRESETMAVLREMGEDAVIYTNEPQPVRLHTGILAFRAPEQWDSIKDAVPENYQEWLAEMKSALVRPNSALVLFHPTQLRSESAPLEVLTEGLVLYRETEDAAIYVNESNLNHGSE